MKMTNRSSLLLAVFLLTTATSSLVAQNVKSEVEALIKSFENAYNRADHATLATMFTADAVRENTDGSTISGTEQISANYAKIFSTAELRVQINSGEIVEQSDGKVLATGTYTVTGKNKQSGEAINLSGSFANTNVRENGQWKISHMKLKAQ